MKIAVTYDNGNVYGHFGHTEQFAIYETEKGKIVRSEIVSTNGTGHGALAAFLAAMGVDTLICGGIGGGARNALAEVGINVYAGVEGNAENAAEALLGGSLGYDPEATCTHHDSKHEHSCRDDENRCGSHGCENNG